MTKFETVGINNLMNATNKETLINRFSWSCNCCCAKGMRIECDRCAIAYNYNILMAIFEDKTKKGDE